MRKTSVVLAALLLTSTLPCFAQRTISRDQARSLVHTALKLRGDKVATRQIQETTDDLAGYYTFGAYDQANGVQNVVGWFAVNKRNGQVWDTTSCELYAFPALERQRHKLAPRAGKSRQKSPCEAGRRTRIVRKRNVRRAAEMPEVAR